MTGNQSWEAALEFLNSMKMIEGKNGINKAGKFQHAEGNLVLAHTYTNFDCSVLHCILFAQECALNCHEQNQPTFRFKSR